MVKAPSMPVWAPSFVPLMRTLAPMMPSPRESLDDPCDLALSGSLLLGAEDTDGLAVNSEDKWSALEQAFDRLLGSYLVEETVAL